MKPLLWTHEQFGEMSWHDNHVHGLSIREGLHGEGELRLDLDYILEWLKAPHGIEFRIVPAVLRFDGVTHLRISLDYASATAALAPFSIHSVERQVEQRDGYVAQRWRILVNWPIGELTFEASGYEQRSRGAEVVSAEQCLRPDQRGDL
jgi:hypothetical protein